MRRPLAGPELTAKITADFYESGPDDMEMIDTWCEESQFIAIAVGPKSAPVPLQQCFINHGWVDGSEPGLMLSKEQAIRMMKALDKFVNEEAA